MDEEIKKILKLARKELNGLVLNEDKEFLKALLTSNIEKEEHKEKLKGINNLIKRMDKIK